MACLKLDNQYNRQIANVKSSRPRLGWDKVTLYQGYLGYVR